MSDQRFPAGWDEESVRNLLAYYDGQTENVAEDEAGMEPSETVMSIPHELVPAQLIAKQRR